MDGITVIFYNNVGGWITGIAFQTIMSYLNWRNPNKNYTWHKHNIIIDGKLNKIHLLCFSVTCTLYFFIATSKLMTIFFSHMSGLNVGVITTLWAVEPLLNAVIDWLLNGVKLGLNHVIGIILIVSGAISIGFAGIGKKQDNNLHAPNTIPEKPNDDMAFHPTIEDPQFPVWVAILWGFMTPCFFIMNTFTMKRNVIRYNFEARTASFGATFVGSSLIFLLGICWYWQVVIALDWKMFGIGLVTSIIDTCSKALIQNAFSKGPAGSVGAVSQFSNILLLIFDALRMLKFPSGYEILGFMLCCSGGLCLILRDQVYRLLRCICCK